jgi:hypothetical protein
MRLRWYALGAVVTMALAGCGGRSKAPAPRGKLPAPKAKMTAAQAALPEWAPKKPSPEFLRAAKVLKPIPLATARVPGVSDAENAAYVKEMTIVAQAGYEFFGTLSDEQVQRLLTSQPGKEGSRELLIPFTALTPSQRRAFDNFVNAFAKGRAVSHPDSADYRVELYRMGATRDLSNVRVGFWIQGHYVSLCSRVTAGAKTGTNLSSFAMW